MCWALVLPNDGYAGVVNVQDNVSNLSQNFGSEVTILSSTQAKRYYDPTRLKEKAN
jgi:hypothetical protein